jgi:quercetin dioxygenase-like cupin family protein
MVGSNGCLDPAAALTYPAQLAPSRRAQVAHYQLDIAISVDSMIVAGNTKITDLLCATPPPIPRGAHSMTQLVELPPADGLGSHRHSGPVFGYVLQGRILIEIEGEAPTELAAGEAFWEPGGEVVHYQMGNLDATGWSSFFAVCICAPGVDMITMLEPQEIAARDSLRHPSARRNSD